MYEPASACRNRTPIAHATKPKSESAVHPTAPVLILPIQAAHVDIAEMHPTAPVLILPASSTSETAFQAALHAHSNAHSNAHANAHSNAHSNAKIDWPCSSVEKSMDCSKGSKCSSAKYPSELMNTYPNTKANTNTSNSAQISCSAPYGTASSGQAQCQWQCSSGNGNGTGNGNGAGLLDSSGGGCTPSGEFGPSPAQVRRDETDE